MILLLLLLLLYLLLYFYLLSFLLLDKKRVCALIKIAQWREKEKREPGADEKPLYIHRYIYFFNPFFLQFFFFSFNYINVLLAQARCARMA